MSHARTRLCLSGVLFLFALTQTPCAAARIQAVQLVKIAATGTRIPGGSLNFEGFGIHPSISGGVVAFYGRSASFVEQAILTSNGATTEAVVDLNDLIPGGTGRFTSLGLPVLSGSRLAFQGLGANAQDGIYMANAGSLSRIADRNTAIPGGTGTFTAFSTPSISGNVVALWGRGASGQRGIYVHDGSLRLIANTETAIPSGSGNFVNFGTAPPILGDIAFFFGAGSDNQRGLYRFDGTLSAVVDQSVPIPAGVGTFSNFGGNFGVSPSLVAFYAIDQNFQSGIYANDGSSTRRIADVNTPFPGGTENFLGFNEPAVSNGAVVFRGLGAWDREGVYADFGDGIEKIVETSDALEGKSIRHLHVATTGIHERQIALFVEFVDGSQSIYRADVTLAPAPVPARLSLSGLLAFVASLMGIGLWFTRAVRAS